MERENPRLWNDMPPRVREAVHARVQEQLPDIVRSVTDEIGANIDQLLDVKLMVIRRIEQQPDLANRIFLEVGRRELRFIINFGFFFGFACGIPTAIITEVLFHEWWLLPIAGVIIGYVTNLLAIKMIFEPVEPRKIGPFKLHGLFLRRQPEVAEVYGEIIAEDIVTIGNIGDDLLNGPRVRPHALHDRDRDAPRDRPRRGPGADGRAGRRRHARPTTRSASRSPRRRSSTR